MTKTHNRPSLDDFLADPACLRGQPLGVLAVLFDETKALADKASVAKKTLTAEMERRYGAVVDLKYRADGKDTGTVRLPDGDFEIVAERTKKVEWDQGALRAAVDAIASSGDDPAEYVRSTLTVEERAFTAWPSHIRAVFEPARTLKPGALTMKIVAKSAEAA